MRYASASPSARSATRSGRSSVFTSPRWSFSLLTGLALIGALASSAAGGLADQVGATFSLMLQDVVSAFPAIEGLVVQVDGDHVYMDLSQKDGVLLGQEYTIFRKGEVFRHPSSGKPLGRYEEVLGYAQVRRVEPSFSEAAFVPIEGKPLPRPDLTKANADLRRVPFMLALAMDQTKRFQSVDPGQVNELLLNSKMKGEELLVRPDRAVSLGRSLDVMAWLVPVLLERRGVTYLDVTWISAVTGAPLFSRRQALARADNAGDQRFPWEPRIED